RQTLRFGTSTPKRVSRKRRSDVWSNVSEQTKPPREYGETRRSGTRKPSPIGPATPAASPGSGFTLSHSPGVPFGATGGGRWSKKPPFSSYVIKSAVLDQTLGFKVRALSTRAAATSPYVTGAGGCSLCTSGARTQETCGNVPAAQSASNVPGNVGVNAFAASAGVTC